MTRRSNDTPTLLPQSVEVQEPQPQLPLPLPATRIGIVAELAATSCCVGPTVLALVGAVSAANAFVWATRLYDGYA